MLSPLPFTCPPDLLTKAQANPPTVTAVVGADAALALESARQAAEASLIDPVLVGDPDRIAAEAGRMDWDTAGIRVVPASGEQAVAETGVALARSGEVAALMKGQVHTDSLMRAVVQRDTGLRGDSRMSHVFHMTATGREGAVLITDAAVNVAPPVDVRLDILRNAVGLAHALGNSNPKVAVLSATESEIEAMPSSLEAGEIARRAQQGEVKDALVQGPLALDGAISPEAARIKGLTGPVAGHADILLVPTIETGNALFKGMVYYMSATAAGLVLGAKVPIVLTSRADPPEARLAAMALAAIKAQYQG